MKYRILIKTNNEYFSEEEVENEDNNIEFSNNEFIE